MQSPKQKAQDQNTTASTEHNVMRTNARFGLRARLLLATLMLCTSLVAATFWCAQHAAKNAARIRFGDVSATTFKLMSEATQHRISSLDDSVSAAILDPVFRAQLSRLRQNDAAFGLDESTATTELPVAEVHDVLVSAELPYFRRYDFFLIVSNEKKLVLNRAQSELHGEIVKLAMLDRAEQIGGVSEFVPGTADSMKSLGADPKQLYLMMTKKIVVAGLALGYVVVGESVNHGLLMELDRVSQAYSGIVINGKIWSRDANAASVAENFLKNVVGKKSDAQTVIPFWASSRTDFEWMGQEYFVQAGDNGLVLVKPISTELALLTHELVLQFIVFVAPLSMLALFFTFAYAQFFSKPIVDLTAEVKKVKEGNYAAKMPVLRTDEVGELARAFNEMTESLSALRIDPLTGLYSEQYLKDTLAFELSYAITHKRQLVLVNLKIADFENMILKSGEDEARNILQGFADHFSIQHKRTKDVAARGDEDEFWLLMIDTDFEHARESCQRILADKHTSMQALHLGLAVFNAHVSEVDGFMQAARLARVDAEKLGAGHMALARGVSL
jgi:diguanylate cyclase (GGDEF)-like protein